MIPLLSPLYPWADLTRAGEREDRCLQPAGGTRDTAAFPELDPVDVAPQERPPVAGSRLIRLHGAGFRLQFQTAAKHLPSGATAGASSACAPLRLLRFVPALKASGSLLRLLRSVAVDLRQKSSRCCSQAFHSSNLSAPRGLAAGVYGQHTDRRKHGNVREAVGEIRNVER